MTAARMSAMKTRSQRANSVRPWFARLLLLLPAAAIVFAAAPRLVSGLALEAAFPATAYMAMNVPLPPRTYAGTAEILSHVPVADGEAQVLRAEAALHAGEPLRTVAPRAEAALTHVPASARGWIVLAQTLRESDPRKAASALALAVELAPHERFLVVPRAMAGAPLWAYLPQPARDTLLDDARLLASEAELRPGLRELLRGEGGAALVTRAFSGDPEKLRALNRSLARERLGLP